MPWLSVADSTIRVSQILTPVLVLDVDGYDASLGGRRLLNHLSYATCLAWVSDKQVSLESSGSSHHAFHSAGYLMRLIQAESSIATCIVICMIDCFPR